MDDGYHDISPRSVSKREYKSSYRVLGQKVITIVYLHFQSKPLMSLKNFVTVHSLINDTKFD